MRSTGFRISSARSLTLALLALLFALALPGVARATTFASEVPIGAVHTAPPLIAVGVFSPAKQLTRADVGTRFGGRTLNGYITSDGTNQIAQG